jgi:hypothetical protein
LDIPSHGKISEISYYDVVDRQKTAVNPDGNSGNRDRPEAKNTGKCRTHLHRSFQDLEGQMRPLPGMVSAPRSIAIFLMS